MALSKDISTVLHSMRHVLNDAVFTKIPAAVTTAVTAGAFIKGAEILGKKVTRFNLNLNLNLPKSMLFVATATMAYHVVNKAIQEFQGEEAERNTAADLLCVGTALEGVRRGIYADLPRGKALLLTAAVIWTAQLVDQGINKIYKGAAKRIPLYLKPCDSIHENIYNLPTNVVVKLQEMWVARQAKQVEEKQKKLEAQIATKQEELKKLKTEGKQEEEKIKTEELKKLAEQEAETKKQLKKIEEEKQALEKTQKQSKKKGFRFGGFIENKEEKKDKEEKKEKKKI